MKQSSYLKLDARSGQLPNGGRSWGATGISLINKTLINTGPLMTRNDSNIGSSLLACLGSDLNPTDLPVDSPLNSLLDITSLLCWSMRGRTMSGVIYAGVYQDRVPLRCIRACDICGAPLVSMSDVQEGLWGRTGFWVVFESFLFCEYFVLSG